MVIRSLFTAGDGRWTLGTGGGITVHSEVDEEYAESAWKAERLRAVFDGLTPRSGGERAAVVDRRVLGGGAGQPHRQPGAAGGCRAGRDRAGVALDDLRARSTARARSRASPRDSSERQNRSKTWGRSVVGDARALVVDGQRAVGQPDR